MNKLPEWLGKKPITWKLTKLKYLVRINTGSKDTQDKKVNGKYNFYVRSQKIEKIDVHTNEGEAILTAGDGVGVGKVFHYVGGKYSVHQRVYIFNQFKSVLGKFLYYYLKSNLGNEVLNGNAKSTVDSLRKPLLNDFIVIYPDLSIQKMIVKFIDSKLSKIDSLISLKEKQIKLLEEQRQAMITEAVTKGLNPNVKMKDSGVEWIGEIPEHWEVKKIKHLSQVKRGASPRPIDDPKYYAENGDYSWVRISDVTKSGKYLFNTRDKLSELGASKSVKRHRGDLILSIAATVGKACITKIDCCIHDGFVYFDNLKVEEEYLFYIFEAGQCYRGLGKMGTQLNLNTDTVGNITIPVSSRNEIQEIIDYITNKDVEFLNLINAVKRSKEKLKEYRQSLIYEAVTGKILIEEMEAYIKEAEKNGN